MPLFAEEMEKLVDRVREKIDPIIVLPGPYFITNFQCGMEDWSHGYLSDLYCFNDLIAAVARQRKCIFVDLLAAYGETPWMLYYDGVHPNDLGHMIVANEIFKEIAKRCSGLGKHTKALEEKIPRWVDDSVLVLEYGYDQYHTREDS